MELDDVLWTVLLMVGIVAPVALFLSMASSISREGWIAIVLVLMILSFILIYRRARQRMIRRALLQGLIKYPIELYLASDAITATWMAKEIDSLLPANRLRQLDYHFNGRLATSSLKFAVELWEAMVEIASDIRHNDAEQDRLVELIVALSKRPVVLVQTGAYGDVRVDRFWDSMPFFKELVNKHGSSYDSMLRGKRNLVAFFARVQGTGLPYGVPHWGIPAAFNVAVNPDCLQRDKLACAAAWIEHAGDYLWWAVRKSPVDSYTREYQWFNWRWKFDSVANDAQYSVEMRKHARDTVHMMDKLAESMPHGNPKFDNMGEQQWQKEWQAKGLTGPYAEPIVPDMDGGQYLTDVIAAEIRELMEDGARARAAREGGVGGR